MICSKKLQKTIKKDNKEENKGDKENCADFEIRFCCDAKLMEKTNEIGFLSYSDNDFDTEDFKIRFKLSISSI